MRTRAISHSDFLTIGQTREGQEGMELNLPGLVVQRRINHPHERTLAVS